ncbi:MAG: hypothetical protein B0D92_05425 [Spirochaeta sp. LUC14_002_19_P3]|nr:MAG: hypothetical protein B0D92_05425 [Spirochaeta sp. LUC14_002_19_P3]
MQSYILYVEIYHIAQLTRLNSEDIHQLTRDINEIVYRFGGCSLDKHIYSFPQFLSEAAWKTASAAHTIHTRLHNNVRKLYGTAVIICGSEQDNTLSIEKIKTMALRISAYEGMWLEPELRFEFDDCLQLSPAGDMLKIESLKDIGLHIEERLKKFLIRSDCSRIVQRALEKMEQPETVNKILLLRGIAGSGKRAVLNSVLNSLYPDDGGSLVAIPLESKDLFSVEPIIRGLKSISDTKIEDYLDTSEVDWWNTTGNTLYKSVKTGTIRHNVSDRLHKDLCHVFSLSIKSVAAQRWEEGLPTYVLFDSFIPESSLFSSMLPLMGELLKLKGVRFIFIYDSDNFSQPCHLPGKGYEAAFSKPSAEVLLKIIKTAAIGPQLRNREIERIEKLNNGNLYTIFHLLAARRLLNKVTSNTTKYLINSLDPTIQNTLFIVYAAEGLVDRTMIVQRFADSDEQVRELGRCENLLALGLIREAPDGRIYISPGCSKKELAALTEFADEAEKFGVCLCQYFENGNYLDIFRLFLYLEKWGPVNNAIRILEILLDMLLVQRQLSAVKSLLKKQFFLTNKLEASQTIRFQAVIAETKIRYMLLTGNLNKIQYVFENSVENSGHQSELQNACCYYAANRWGDALKAAKNAIFYYQKSNDHHGETFSHIELALTQLALGNIKDALEHFIIAHRIGVQVNVSWGVLRASVLGTVTQFLLGNLSRCIRECRENRKLAQREGRRDMWLLSALLELRIAWEIGRYQDAFTLAEEGCNIAEFYGLNAEHTVMQVWKGRCLLHLGFDEGRAILESLHSNREALAFLAENAWCNGELEEARRIIHLASQIQRKSVRIQGETDDWSDAYYPIEGRLGDSSGHLDVLGERITGMQALFTSQTGNKKAIDQLESLLERDERRIPRPFSYQYALWAAMIIPDRDMQTRYMNRAFNDLQSRAGRFDDGQIKHDWLTANYWNKVLMEEARKRNFLS